MTDLTTLLSIAEAAVDLGRRLLTDGTTGDVTMKADRDYATELDFAIERVIRDHLRRATPEIGFIGEEEGEHRGAAGELSWVLDPVDGTSNLFHGLPMYGISLGLLDQGTPVLGVIDLPVLGEHFTACQGGGARLNGKSIMVRPVTRLPDAIISVGDFAFGPGAAPRNARRLAIMTELAADVERVRMLGSAATDLAWVAAGRLDASILLSNNSWDVTAGVIIAREAGAVIMDADGSQHGLASAATIGASPGLAPQLIDLLARADAVSPSP